MELCRLCARKSLFMTSVFGFSHDRLVIDLIKIICPIKIDPDDDLPKNICDECLEIVMSAIGLREKSVKCERDFRLGTISLQKDQNSSKELVLKKEKEDVMEIGDEELNDIQPSLSEAFLFENYYDSSQHSSSTSESSDSKQTNWNGFRPQAPFNKNSDGRYECPLNCGRSFAYKTAIYGHWKHFHSSKKPKTKTKRQPKGFTLFKQNEYGRFICPFDCGKTFAYKTAIYGHCKQAHSDGKMLRVRPNPPRKISLDSNGRYKCPYDCGKTFAHKTAIYSHCKQVHETDKNQTPKIKVRSLRGRITLNGNGRYDCPYGCDKTFKHTSAIYSHCKQDHEAEGCYEVDPLNERWSNRSKFLSQNKSRSSGFEETEKGTFQCDLCGGIFENLMAIRSHVDTCGGMPESLSPNKNQV